MVHSLYYQQLIITTCFCCMTISDLNTSRERKDKVAAAFPNL